MKAVQRKLGHATAAMTLDTYSHLFDDDLEIVAAKMQDAAGEASVGRQPCLAREDGLRPAGLRGSEHLTDRCPWRDSNPQPFP